MVLLRRFQATIERKFRLVSIDVLWKFYGIKIHITSSACWVGKLIKWRERKIVSRWWNSTGTVTKPHDIRWNSHWGPSRFIAGSLLLLSMPALATSPPSMLASSRARFPRARFAPAHPLRCSAPCSLLACQNQRLLRIKHQNQLLSSKPSVKTSARAKSIVTCLQIALLGSFTLSDPLFIPFLQFFWFWTLLTEKAARVGLQALPVLYMLIDWFSSERNRFISDSVKSVQDCTVPSSAGQWNIVLILYKVLYKFTCHIWSQHQSTIKYYSLSMKMCNETIHLDYTPKEVVSVPVSSWLGSFGNRAMTPCTEVDLSSYYTFSVKSHVGCGGRHRIHLLSSWERTTSTLRGVGSVNTGF